MTNLSQRRTSRIARGTRAALSTSVVVAGLAAATGAIASHGNAPLRYQTNNSAHHHARGQFKKPKLHRGLLTIEGTTASDKIALRLQAGDPAVLIVDVGDDGAADFSFDRDRLRAIEIDAEAGDDFVRIDESNGAFTNVIPTIVDGGDGNDTIDGGSGVETLIGGGGNDTIDGNGGNDQAALGAGDDSFVWDPGDGSDTIEGQDGTDTMVFNGAAAAEQVDLSANGNRLRFFRTQGNITMDTQGVERVDFNALGGVDTATVNDLSGTDVQNVNVDLAGSLGAVTGDRAVDTVTVNGTELDDTITAAGDASGVVVTGLQARVAITHQEPTDQLTLDGLGGNDTISATGLANQAITDSLDAGAGKDGIAGGPGNELLLGGDGNDSIDGNGGADTAQLGSGDDTFVWDPGDGSDTIEGHAGTDTLRFNGAAAAETVDLSANGNHLRFFRNPGNITMDTHGVERVDFNALGGADVVTVHDLSGTDVQNVNVDLAVSFFGTAGDRVPAQVVVEGTNGNDNVTVNGDADGVKVSGLAATVELLDTEAADRLDVDTLAGTDAVDSAGLAAGTLQLFFNGVLRP